MIPFTLDEIAPVLNAERVGKNTIIDSILTDSRIPIAHRCLFIALKGKKFDAHNFAKQAVSNGAAALLVNRHLLLDVPQLIVSDTRRALGQLGAWVRQQVPVRVVALTGSSGKTSVKEMTAAILRQCGRVLATVDNCNNEIGVPLTLLCLTPMHDFAVIELGTNYPGEIAWTTDLVRPETVLVNNLSVSHLAKFGSLSGVAKAKSEIFSKLPVNGLCILNADSHDWLSWQQILNQKTVWRFAIQNRANVDFFASDIKSDCYNMRFILHTPLGECSVKLPLPGKHNIANALAACALALSVGAGLQAVTVGLSQLRAIPGRMFPISLGRGHLLIDDSYNANVGSMTVAAETLSEMPGYRVMVVGDMAELGERAEDYHQEVGKTVSMVGIDKVLSVGNFSHLISEANKLGEHFQDKRALTVRLAQLLSEQVVISVLIKGSRNSEMEQVVQALQREK